MIISMAISFIGVIITAFSIKEIGWIIACIGIPAVFILHAVWGLLIEMSNNIISLNSDTSDSRRDKRDSEKDKADSINSKKWVCKHCFTENPSSSIHCKRCGRLME